MRIDKTYLKDLLNILLDHPAQTMRLSDLGLKIGLMTGNAQDSASIKIHDDQIEKFQTHLFFLREYGNISSNDPTFGISRGANGHLIINSSASYELTPMGYHYAEEINRNPILKTMSDVSGKLIWIFVGGFIGALGTLTVTFIFGTCK